ncbi:hypothetical protein KAMAJI_00330 [Serratia phage vB_SmaM-Kamaji]|nr:hypothetical protein KAMAJI_00330 [Serratia phage vB_SmaM-Kamaji]
MFDIKDHEIRELVSAVTDAAVKYQGCGCMRDVMSRIIGGYLKSKREYGVRPYAVRYDGLWLGGKAIVLAQNEGEAERMVAEHQNTVSFKDVEVYPLDTEGVLHNDNGDY